MKLFFSKVRGFFLFSCLLLFGHSHAQAEKIPEAPLITLPTTEGKLMAKKILAKFPDAPFMVYVANCESTGLIHMENGRLIRGRVDGLDEGVFQVHMPAHRSTMSRMGLNPNNLEHYLKFVRRLYDESGLRPWKSSRKCWSKYIKEPPRG